MAKKTTFQFVYSDMMPPYFDQLAAMDTEATKIKVPVGSLEPAQWERLQNRRQSYNSSPYQVEWCAL